MQDNINMTTNLIPNEMANKIRPLTIVKKYLNKIYRNKNSR